jgi:hypothetical protein
MKLKNPNEKRPMSSEYEALLVRPNPPTPEMVAAAQPYRADVIGADLLIDLAKRSAALSK